MPDDLHAAKQVMRKQMSGVLSHFTAYDRGVKSQRIIANLHEQTRWFVRGARIALFSGLSDEPELSPMIPWLLRLGIQPVLFGFAEGELVPRCVASSEDIARGPLGVLVPNAACPIIEASALDVILAPGLAFDEQLRRLGRGRGYFDKLFARCSEKVRRIGVCFEVQIVNHVPTDRHDVTMHGIITEDRVLI